MPTSATHPAAATSAAALAAAGLLLAAGGLMHPQAESGAGYEEALAGMFGASAWTASHGLTMAGFLLVSVALAALVRVAGPGWTAPARAAAWAVVAGAALATVESAPHLLASSEADALVRGDATPLTDLHALLQAFSTPAVGLAVAALALTTARDRTLGNGRVAAAAATVGGLAYGFAGPLMLLTEDPAFSPLFAGAAAMAAWILLAGARTSRRLRAEATTTRVGVVATR